jgi:hypothetical protein
VYSPVGDQYKYTVDISTTVESLLLYSIYKEKFFSKEPDPELYWLFRFEEKFDQFDSPLPKDKKILKLLYKQEKADILFSRDSEEDYRRSSLLKKRTSRIPRRDTTVMSPIDALPENEF